jgi:hypothetical protein
MAGQVEATVAQVAQFKDKSATQDRVTSGLFT